MARAMVAATGAARAIGSDNVYRSTSFVGEAVRRAYDDAVAWVAERDADPDRGGGSDA